MVPVKATVLMPVYNGALYLREAVDSILAQSFGDFELLIFDDGSIDGSREILQSYKDPRIQLFLQDENTGYVRHLNRGIRLARGEYIFRMDSDDIALPDRFEKQIAFLDQNPEVGLCGSWIRTLEESPKTFRKPSDHEEIILSLLNGPTISHPSSVMRASVLHRYNLRYEEEYLFAEDYDLWVRMSGVSRLAILPEVLLRYRVHDNSVSFQHNARQIQLVNKIRIRQFEQILDRPLDEIEKQWATFDLSFNEKFPFSHVRSLINAIKLNNERKKIYDSQLLNSFLKQRTAKLYNRQKVRKIPRHLLNSFLLQSSFPGISKYMRSLYIKSFLRLPFRFLKYLRTLL